MTILMPSGGFFDPIKLEKEIANISEIANNPNLWENPDRAREIMQKKAGLEKNLNDFLKTELKL